MFFSCNKKLLFTYWNSTAGGTISVPVLLWVAKALTNCDWSISFRQQCIKHVRSEVVDRLVVDVVFDHKEVVCRRV